MKIKVARPVKILSKVLYFLALACVGILLVLTLSQRLGGGEASLLGHRMYIVLSGSMSPEFEAGSLIVARERPTGEIGTGDILTFSVSGEIVSHRVVEVTEENGSSSFITKGDANNVADTTPVTPQQIKGVVVLSVNGLGLFLLWLQKPWGWIILVAVLLVGFLLSKLQKPRALETEEPA